MRTDFTSLTVVLLAFGFVNAATYRHCNAQEAVDFDSQIRPLLLQHCGSCHGVKDRKSGLRLDARHGALKGGDSGPVIVPGKSAESELIRRIMSSSSDDRMPPDGEPVPAADIALIARWIDLGAEWPESDYDREAAFDPRRQHWAFQSLRPWARSGASSAESDPLRTSPTTSAITAGTNGDNSADNFAVYSVDDFIRTKLAEHGLHPNPEADRRTLIRRATLDLTGLPPTPERLDQFVADDSPQAWSSLIDELLASPRYGERWAQHWLDVIRYADTHGFEVNTPRDNAWPYRDYVIRSLNNNKPYDQFIREQIAGDLLNADEATGFLVASAVLLPGQIGADEASMRLARQDALDEIIVGTSSTLLGLTIGCARCHDHKFDPITAEDYYSLQAFFAGVEYGERPIRDVDDQAKQLQITRLSQQIAGIESKLQSHEPIASTHRLLVLDEEDKTVATWLRKENGPGINPDGSKRGYRNDPGSRSQSPNLSGGRYTWWNNEPGADVMFWAPSVDGNFRLWLSWGAHGSGVHTRDARYVLDHDGDLQTRDDQQEIAVVDQYFQAGLNSGETEKTPLWSGLLDIGVVNLTAQSCLILRSGETGTGITSDVIVLKAVSEATGPAQSTTDNFPQFRAPVSPRQNVERFQPVNAKFVRFTTFETVNNNQHEPCLDELEIYSPAHADQNIALASNGVIPTSSGNYSESGIHQLKHVHDGLYGNDHSWISSTPGGGWVQLELPEVRVIDRVVWGRDREGKFPDRLPIRYEVSISTDGRNWSVVAGHQDRVALGTPFDSIQAILRNQSADAPHNLVALTAELESLRAEKKALETPKMVFAGTFREPDKTYLLRRGDPEQRLQETQPAVPSIFSSKLTEPNANETAALTQEQVRRLQLANWIASPANPLTARVMVNRIWQYHFGRGLVETANDFGVNGTPPTHPKLLDWLAEEFIQSGWSINHIHRLIMNSATYRQSNRVNEAAAQIDRDNSLCWKFTSRRIESEAIRDCLLLVSGELNFQSGGPGFNFFRARGGLDGFPPLEEFTPNEMRRMIYAHKVRMEQVPVFGAFDCPDGGQSMSRRSRSTTAIQALNLFNSPFVIDRATQFAARVIQEHPDSADRQIDQIFRLAFGRAPSELERTACLKVGAQHGLATVCRAVMNSSEFLFLP